MELTVKNVAKRLINDPELNTCSKCGSETRLCGWGIKNEAVINIVCESCGTQAEFLKVLTDFEKDDLVDPDGFRYTQRIDGDKDGL